MKSLNEQIKEVMQKNASKAVKTQDLIKLGIKAQDIANLFKVYQVDGDDAISYTLGVEIECFNVDRDRFLHLVRRQGIEIQHEDYNHDTRNHYKVVSDSSILGDNALECVSPVLKGKTGLKSLKKVCDSLNQSGAQVNRSTGLHVHVGLQGIDIEQYKSIFVNYYFLENAIDKFMANSRRGNSNTYCRSITYDKSVYLAECQTFEKIAQVFSYERYFKVNPMSYSRHNTLEFRQHQGTADYAKIEMWVKFICKLVKWSKNNRLDAGIDNISDIPFLSEKEKSYFTNRAAALAAA